MIEIIKFRKHENPALAEKAFDIRRQVFVDEQGVAPEIEYDEFEDIAWHYILEDNGEPVATGRWRETGKGVKLERFATLKPHRNQGYGEKLIRHVIRDVLPLNRPIYLHSQLQAVPLYERAGFMKKGDVFMEAGIQHYLMQRG
ncbi:MAG: GNAT family N-acetyltransferase [Bacteroidales bacterium]